MKLPGKFPGRVVRRADAFVHAAASARKAYNIGKTKVEMHHGVGFRSDQHEIEGLEVKVKDRGQGHATHALKQITAWADKHKQHLMLHAAFRRIHRKL
jgi:hypothetical protein